MQSERFPLHGQCDLLAFMYRGVEPYFYISNTDIVSHFKSA